MTKHSKMDQDKRSSGASQSAGLRQSHMDQDKRSSGTGHGAILKQSLVDQEKRSTHTGQSAILKQSLVDQDKRATNTGQSAIVKQSLMDQDKRSTGTAHSALSSLADKVERLGQAKDTLEHRIRDLEERVAGTPYKDDMMYNYVVEKQLTQMQWSRDRDSRDFSSTKEKEMGSLQRDRSAEISQDDSHDISVGSYSYPRRAVLRIQQLPYDDHKPRTVVNDKGEVFIIYSPSESLTKHLGKEHSSKSSAARFVEQKCGKTGMTRQHYLGPSPLDDHRDTVPERKKSHKRHKESDYVLPEEEPPPLPAPTPRFSGFKDCEALKKKMQRKSKVSEEEESSPPEIGEDPAVASSKSTTSDTESKPTQSIHDSEIPEGIIDLNDDSSYNHIVKENDEWKYNITKLLELLVINAYRDQMPKCSVKELLDPATRDKALVEMLEKNCEKESEPVVIPQEKSSKFFFCKGNDSKEKPKAKKDSSSSKKEDSNSMFPPKTFAQYPPYPPATFESKESLMRQGSSRRQITVQPSNGGVGGHGGKQKEAEASGHSNKIDIVCPPGTRPIIHIPPSGAPDACTISRPVETYDCCTSANPCKKHRQK